MLYTLKKTARDMFFGALLASVAWGSAIAPHVNWSLDMGNQPKALMQAANESIAIAEQHEETLTKAATPPKPARKPALAATTTLYTKGFKQVEEQK